jgi:hypothetical protein
MDNAEKFHEFIENNLRGLVLETPLFYNNPIGIRFEIGVPYRQVSSDKYFTNVYLRSNFIFDEVFEEDDEMFIIIRWVRDIEPYTTFNKGLDVFPDMIKNKNILNKASLIEMERYIEDNGDLSGISYQYVLICKKYDVDYKRILRAIANSDHAIYPYTSNGVFFINTKKNIIYYLYDDRGLDLVSNDEKNLKDIYTKFNDWILDYDRERIDKVFKE